VFGFPKKLAEVDVGAASVRVRRPGLAPGDAPGLVYPIEIVRGHWVPERGPASPGEDLWGFLNDRVALAASRAALAAVRSVFDLPFYTHQVLVAPRSSAGPGPTVSRVWRSPLDNVRIEGAAGLGEARFALGASTIDPLHRYAPGKEAVVTAAAGVRVDVSFSMDASEIVADDTVLPAAQQARVAHA
jgi:hypothetical protein